MQKAQLSAGAKLSTAAVFMVGTLLALPASSQQEERLSQAREIVDDFQQQLGARLMAALAEGGPVAAIEICSMAAPQIAADLSGQAGPAVARTALRVRNPDNSPDSQARAVLEQFEDALERDAATIPEHLEVMSDGSVRYMKAIVTQPLCVVCHGSELTPEVRDAIDRRYPFDEATGFDVGELRGAFVVEWPAAL